MGSRGAPSGDTSIRAATTADLGTIMAHRRQMFWEMGYRDESALDAMHATSEPFFRHSLESGSYRGWLAESGGRVVAGGGIVIVGFPSAPSDPTPRRAWILNMYTDPAFRGRGLARSILEAMIRWCREQHLRCVFLHASDAGRHLYETLGFAPTNEMRLVLK